MLLDELENLRKQLSERIDLHEVTLKKSEAATRYALIDPVLNLLGWDLTDLSKCIPEFKNMDYALFSEDNVKNPIIVIEAKSLDTKMSEKVQTQLVTYCVTQGVNYGILTDGRKWIIYDVFQAKALEEKVIVEFDICDQEESVVMKSLWLWRGNFHGEVAPMLPKRPLLNKHSSQRKASKVAVQRASKLVNLTMLVDNPEKVNFPCTIVYPDNSKESAGDYKKMSTSVLSWLHKRGNLDSLSMPFKAKGVFINDESLNASEKPFQGPIYVEGFYCEGSRNKENHCRFMNNLLRTFGYNPEDVRVI